MTVRCYREWTTELLLKLKKDLEFQASNWTRRIKDKQTSRFDPMYQAVTEYKSRIRECKKHLKQIDKVLKERGVML